MTKSTTYLSLIVSLSILIFASGCIRRSRKIDDPIITRGNARKQPDEERVVPRESTKADLHSSAFSLRKTMREALIEKGKPGQLEHDLAVIHRAEGAAIPFDDANLPSLPVTVKAAADRLQKAALAPGGGRVILALLSELQTRSCPVRHLFALILAPVPGSDLSRILKDQVKEGNSEEMRQCAAAALGQRDEPDIALALIPALVDEQCGDVAAASILRLSKDQRHRNGIEEAVLKSLATDEVTVKASVRLIDLSAKLKMRQAGQVMTQWLEPEVDVRLAVAAAKALADLPSRFATAQLRHALSDPRAEVRAAVIESLTANQDVLSAETFRILARRDADWRVRRACVRAFGRLMDRRSEDALLASLADSAWQVRVAALESLRALKFSSALVSIRGRLSSPIPRERVAAVLALGSLKDQGSVERLGELLRKDVILVRSGAGQALGEIANSAAFAELSEGIEKNKSQRVVLLSIFRACRKPAESNGLASVTLRKKIFGISGPLKRDLELKTAAVVTAHKLLHEKAGAELAKLGDQMLVLLKSERARERELGRTQLVEIAGRDFGFDPDAKVADRESLSRQIEQWWAWKRSSL
ncbi:MAG: HEAT repeat domain-containing protein [Planctomycetota bacterium]|nr:HEAT repeat domain-containing protein [Planctomycetota bacterium]